MAYQVLARKWRPKNFASLVGQEHVVKALKNALNEGRLHHAYLLTGTRGVGKTTIARILAKSLNCESAQGGEPCGVCQSCSQIDAGRYVDLLEIDAASNTGIDNIREVLENAQYAPTAGKYKVYIIDEVHMLSKSAFNAMLKTLEEPPEHVKFILATTDPHKVPITILSRCLQFVLRNMTHQQVADHLAYVLQQENIPFESSALYLLGRSAAGSMRDALSLLDQAIAMGSGSVNEADVRQMIGAVDQHYLFELLQGIAKQDGEALLQKAQEMLARSIGFDHALSELAALLQKLALIQQVPSAVSNNEPEYAILHDLANRLTGEQIQLYYQCVIHGKKDLSFAPDEYSGFVMTLLRILAFTPMAASKHSYDDHIVASDLHNPNPTTGAIPTKKPETPVINHTVAATTPVQTAVETAPSVVSADAQVVHLDEEQDTPPWESAAEDLLTGKVQEIQPQNNEVSSVNQSVIVSETAVLEPQSSTQTQQTADTVFTHHIISETSTTEAEIWTEPKTPTETVFSSLMATHSSENALGEPKHQSESIDVAEANLLEAAEVETEETEGDDEQADFTAMPEWKAENWASILQRLSSRLGAAQMLAEHTAWVRFDESQYCLFLALKGNSNITTNRANFNKITQVLVQAYHFPHLKLQTQAWDDTQNWETPAMRRVRIQQENKQLAQNLLEQDTACRHLMKTLNCHTWHEHSLELIANQTA